MKGKMKKLICKNCKHEETLEDINLSFNTKILIAQVPRVREKDGLNIYPLHCLKCDILLNGLLTQIMTLVKQFMVSNILKLLKLTKSLKPILSLQKKD